MSSVFLCHSSKDKAFVRKLASKLEREGMRVWLDGAEIDIGDSLLNKIGKAIDKMEYFIIVLSNNFVDSEWARIELPIAIQKELSEKRVAVLPLLLHNVEIPPFLMNKKFSDFTDGTNFDASMELLLNVLRPKRSIRVSDVLKKSQDVRQVARKSTVKHALVDGSDIEIVNISRSNLGFLSNTKLVYNDVRTITIKHDYLSEIVKFVVTRAVYTVRNTSAYRFFYGAEILERSIQV
jgi:TIR domain